MLQHGSQSCELYVGLPSPEFVTTFTTVQSAIPSKCWPSGISAEVGRLICESSAPEQAIRDGPSHAGFARLFGGSCATFCVNGATGTTKMSKDDKVITKGQFKGNRRKYFISTRKEKSRRPLHSMRFDSRTAAFRRNSETYSFVLQWASRNFSGLDNGCRPRAMTAIKGVRNGAY